MAPLTPSIQLEHLNPRWIDVGGGRFNVAFEFDCPTHGEPCRLECFVDNPGDGGPPIPGKRLHHRLDGDEHGGALDELTVRTLYGDGPLVFHGHWRGWIDHGALYASRVDPDEVETEPNVPVVSEP